METQEILPIWQAFVPDRPDLGFIDVKAPSALVAQERAAQNFDVSPLAVAIGRGGVIVLGLPGDEKPRIPEGGL